ncbi:unnamed protein product, partial [Didymodactylos carnosus]
EKPTERPSFSEAPPVAWHDLTHSPIPQIINTFIQTHNFPFIDQIKNPVQSTSDIVFIQNILSDLLRHWLESGLLTNDQDVSILRDIINLFSSIVNVSSEFVALDKTFIKTIQLCIQDVAKRYQKYLNDVNMAPFCHLVEILLFKFPNSADFLFKSIVYCLYSTCYVDAFLNFKEQMKPVEEFLLITCPKYFHSIEKQNQVLSTSTAEIDYRYNEIYEQMLPSISKWNSSILSAMHYMTSILIKRIKNLYSNKRRQKLFYHLLFILKNTQISTELIHSTLVLFYNLITNHHLQYQIKREEKNLSVIFFHLLSSNHGQIVLYSCKILAHIINDEQQDEYISKITSVFLDFIQKTVDDPVQEVFGGTTMDMLLKDFKELLRCDKVKQEVIKRNGLMLLIQCASNGGHDQAVPAKTLQLLLEILLQMITVNTSEVGIEQIKQYQNFIEKCLKFHLKLTDKKIIMATQSFLEKLGEKEEKEATTTD